MWKGKLPDPLAGVFFLDRAHADRLTTSVRGMRTGTAKRRRSAAKPCLSLMEWIAALEYTRTNSKVVYREGC
jgi:hypothetical protein